jgi:hypothetical protein
VSAQLVPVVNAGSGSVEIRLLNADDDIEFAVDLPADRGRPDAGALADTLRGLHARPRTVVVTAREDRVIAAGARMAMSGQGRNR